MCAVFCRHRDSNAYTDFRDTVFTFSGPTEIGLEENEESLVDSGVPTATPPRILGLGLIDFLFSLLASGFLPQEGSVV